uniref:Protein kinase domain-containing protein n=1 Tax=Strigamia maritima TaxID=126957 RepID=T1II48_STRMM
QLLIAHAVSEKSFELNSNHVSCHEGAFEHHILIFSSSEHENALSLVDHADDNDPAIMNEILPSLCGYLLAPKKSRCPSQSEWITNFFHSRKGNVSFNSIINEFLKNLRSEHDAENLTNRWFEIFTSLSKFSDDWFKEIPPEWYVTLRQLMNAEVPAVKKYEPSESTGWTSVNKCAMKTTKLWTEFHDNAQKFRLEDRRLNREEMEFRFSKRLEIFYKMPDLYSAMDSNIFNPLKTILYPEESFKGKIQFKGNGFPDFHLCKEDVLFFVGEGKTENCFVDNDSDQVVDLTRITEENMEIHPRPLLRSLQQLFNYLRDNYLNYGFLSVYTWTWFVKQNESDESSLYVSKPYHCTCADPTLLRCFAYIISLCRANPTFNIDNSRSKNTKRSRDEETEPRKLSKKEYNVLTCFNWKCVIGEGRTGYVWLTEWRGAKAVIKSCDAYKRPYLVDELKNEKSIFNLLYPLQGVCIPKLLFTGFVDYAFLIITEFIGPPIDIATLNVEAKMKIETALERIHGLKILHGDIKPSNILMRDQQYYFIDFAFSKKCSSQAKFDDEVKQLRHLLSV